MREILLADPSLGPVKLMKIDLSDGFYYTGLNIYNIPKVGVVFPTKPDQEPLTASPLVLRMGQKNSPPFVCTATKTIVDFDSQRIQAGATPTAPLLDDEAEAIVPSDPLYPSQLAHQIKRSTPSCLQSPQFSSNTVQIGTNPSPRRTSVDGLSSQVTHS